MLIAAIAIVTAFAISSFRQRALEAHQYELENTLVLLARHFDQQLSDFVLVQQGIAEDLESSGTTSPDVFKGEMSTLDVHERLRTKVSGSSDVAGVNVYSSDGVLINSSEAWPVRDINVADRKCFQDLKANTNSGNLVQVVRSRFVDKKWTVVFATRVSGRHGEFMGVLTRGIDSEAFEEFFRSVAVSAGGAVSLFHADGTLLARYPRRDDAWAKLYNQPGPSAGAVQIRSRDYPA
jgi:hypothetical protein